MSVSGGEKEPQTGTDPVIAFLHDENKPFEGIIDASGEVVTFEEQKKTHLPPLPVVFVDRAAGTERIATKQEQTEFLEPQRQETLVTRIRRKLFLAVNRV